VPFSSPSSAHPIAGDQIPPAPGEEITLQISLSAGDLAYAHLTVPALVRAHPQVAHRIAVVDLCRPQRTRIFDPDRRLPEPEFSARVQRLRELALHLQRDGLFDELVWLEPGSFLFPALARKYTAEDMAETLDYGGCANMPYWAAIDAPSTRFVLHYDADMCLYQASGYDWALATLEVWKHYPQAVFATPRISPPALDQAPERNLPSIHERRPLEHVPAGWLNDWFSTRCFLVDRHRLSPLLPLARGRLTAEYRLRRWLNRGYPPSPEMLLFRSLGSRGFRRLNLADPRAWLLHPTNKPPAYLTILPQLLECISTGHIPAAQRGRSEIDLVAWGEFLRSTTPTP